LYGAFNREMAAAQVEVVLLNEGIATDASLIPDLCRAERKLARLKEKEMQLLYSIGMIEACRKINRGFDKKDKDDDDKGGTGGPLGGNTGAFGGLSA
jgi:hypothetical protein